MIRLIIEDILDFLQENFTGGRIIGIFGWFVCFPKLAPLMITAMLVALAGDQMESLTLSIIGYSMILVGIFCFFMLRIFPHREFNGLTNND